MASYCPHLRPTVCCPLWLKKGALLPLRQARGTEEITPCLSGSQPHPWSPWWTRASVFFSSPACENILNGISPLLCLPPSPSSFYDSISLTSQLCFGLCLRWLPTKLNRKESADIYSFMHSFIHPRTHSFLLIDDSLCQSDSLCRVGRVLPYFYIHASNRAPACVHACVCLNVYECQWMCACVCCICVNVHTLTYVCE